MVVTSQEDGDTCGSVGLGYVVGKGTVPEDACGVAGRGQLLVPGDDALGEGFDITGLNLRIQAGDEYAAGDSLHCLLLH